MAKKQTNFINEEIGRLSDIYLEQDRIEQELFVKYDVKRGLRDLKGKGVLTGLTEISEIRSSKLVDGERVPCEGKLFYRGYNVEDIIRDFDETGRFGFEEVIYLLLFGKLPKEEEISDFRELLADYRTLPKNFVRDVIMKSPTKDMMHTLSKSVMALCSYDKEADNIEIPNVLRQCLQLTAVFPMLAVYGYHAYNHYVKGQSLIIHRPVHNLSIAENLLYMLRPDSKYTALEAKVLDLALILHAEHGGGNNSTFTMHVVTSSGTDTYSAVTASLCSLKGPKHGGANIKVVQMFDDLKKHVKDWKDEEAIARYLDDLLEKKAFDKAGLIYGVGHAVYSVSDPRANALRKFVEELSIEKGKEKEYELYKTVERLAPQVIGKKRNIYKGVSANIDFYSGFAYKMLGLPDELYTPLFAIGRIAGWSAHRLEELYNAGKIIRPTYMNVQAEREYVPLSER